MSNFTDRTERIPPLQDPALDPDGVCPECSGLRKPCTACNSTGLLSVAYSMAKGQNLKWQEWADDSVPHAEDCAYIAAILTRDDWGRRIHGKCNCCHSRRPR